PVARRCQRDLMHGCSPRLRGRRPLCYHGAMSAHPNVIAALTAAVQQNPADLPLRLHLAGLLLETGEYAAALEHFGVLLSRDPAHLEALRGAARAAEG